MSNKNQELLPFTVIYGNEMDGTLSQAVYLTKQLIYRTSFIDMEDPGMEDGELTNYLLVKNVKAIIVTGVKFPEHTERIKKIISFEIFNTAKQKIEKPAFLIISSSAFEKIPTNIFPGKVGLLKCG